MQTPRKNGKSEQKKKDYRMEHIYNYLFENNIQASCKCFEPLAEGILYAIDNPTASYDFIINRLALAHGELATQLKGNIRYTINRNTGSTPKAFLFNAAAYLRMNIGKEEHRKGKLIAFSS